MNLSNEGKQKRDTGSRMHGMRRIARTAGVLLLVTCMLTGCTAVDYSALANSIRTAGEAAEDETEQAQDVIRTGEVELAGEADNGGTAGGIRKAETDLTEIPAFGYSAEDLRELIPHYELRYFLHDLDDEMKENFLALYLAVSEYDDSCILPHSLDEEGMEVMQYLLSFECPELLHYQGSTMELWDMKHGSSTAYQEMHFNYALSREDSQAQYKQCRSEAEAIAATAEKETDGSDLAREKYAYDYLTSRIYYNIQAPNSGNAFGALVSNQAKCDGISLGMKWVCEEMGIPCMILAGQENGDPIGHAWNIIGIDGEFYDVDVTLDVQGEGKPVYNLYPAFNVSRTWIRDNFPVKEVYRNHFVIPGSVSMDRSYHACAGEFFKTGESCWQHYSDALDAAMEDGDHTIMLQFESYGDFAGFVSTVSDMHQDWVNSRRTNISSNMLRNEKYRTVSMEITFN